jgi:hypothetical protein
MGRMILANLGAQTLQNAPFPLDFHFRTMKTLGTNAWGTAYDNEANMKEHPSVYCHMTILHHHHW